MTELKFEVLQLANVDPEYKPLSQGSLEDMRVKQMLVRLRKYNAGRNRGELNFQFKEWIFCHEAVYTAKIADIYTVGKHKQQLAYYGMIYTILKWTGCYLLGKKSSPIGITHNRYCEELCLTDRLKSNNARKALADNFYGHNYFPIIEAKANNERVVGTSPELDALEPVFEELFYAIRKKFLE